MFGAGGGTDFCSKSKYDALYQKITKWFGTPTPPAHMPGMPGIKGRRRDSENGEEQGRASQQLVSFMPNLPGGVNQVAPASSLELDLPRVQGIPGEGGSAEDHAREAYHDLQDGTPWMKERMTIWEDWCLEQKRNKNRQGKDPRTFEENKQGRDPCTLVRNSQGKDPDAAARRLEPKGEAEVPKIIIVSDAVEGTFVNLDGKSPKRVEAVKRS